LNSEKKVDSSKAETVTEFVCSLASKNTLTDYFMENVSDSQFELATRNVNKVDSLKSTTKTDSDSYSNKEAALKEEVQRLRKQIDRRNLSSGSDELLIERLEDSNYVLVIPNGADVTLTDSAATKGYIKGTPVASGKTSGPASLIQVKGKLTLAGAALVSDYTCVKVDEDPGVGEFVMNSGSLEIIANDNGYTGATFAVMNWGEATINGGSIKGNVQALSYNENKESKESTMTINGGTFDPAKIFFYSYDNKTTGSVAAICDRDTVIAASGSGRKEILEKRISAPLEQLMENRSVFGAPTGSTIPVTEDCEALGVAVAAPILSAGDVLGCVIFAAAKEAMPLGETEQKLAQTVAGFLGKQMEE